MNAGAFSRLQRFGSAFDIAFRGSRQTGNNAAPDCLCDFIDCFEVTIGGDREPGFDDIDAHSGKLSGNPQLFIEVHGTAG